MIPALAGAGRSPHHCAQRGASLVAAVFVLLLLSSVAAWVISTASVQQTSSAADLNGARALQAARAGLEWGAWQVLRNPAGGWCAGASDSATLANLAGGLEAFTAVVACEHTSHQEASAVPNVEMFTLTATACNQPPCPSANPGANYVERQVTMILAR